MAKKKPDLDAIEALPSVTHAGVEDRLVVDLRPHPDNPKSGTPDEIASLAASLKRDPSMLTVRPLVALPNGDVIMGNHRLEAAKLLGWESIPAVTVHGLSEARAREWAIKDNNEWIGWDFDQLPEYLHGVDEDALQLLGFTDDELHTLLDGTNAGDLLEPPAGGPGNDGYSEQYGVIVVCEGEEQQAAVYEALAGTYDNVRVVTT
jgi:hypothetical protein